MWARARTHIHIHIHSVLSVHVSRVLRTKGFAGWTRSGHYEASVLSRRGDVANASMPTMPSGQCAGSGSIAWTCSRRSTRRLLTGCARAVRQAPRHSPRFLNGGWWSVASTTATGPPKGTPPTAQSCASAMIQHCCRNPSPIPNHRQGRKEANSTRRTPGRPTSVATCRRPAVTPEMGADL